MDSNVINSGGTGTGVTAGQVKAAADAIAARGERPTNRGVRIQLGNTGSMGTIQRYVAEWREERPAAVQASIAVSEELNILYSKDVQRRIDAATTNIRAENADYVSEAKEQGQNVEGLDRQIKELEAAAVVLVQERDEAQAEFKAAAGEASRLTENLKQDRENIRDQQQELATATIKIEVLDGQISDLKSDLSTVRSQLAKTIDDKQKAEKATDKAQAETALEKHKADEAIDQEAKSVRLMQTQIDDLKLEVARARTDAKEARTDVREARAETKKAHQDWSREVEQWGSTVALEHKRNAQLQSERDTLADEVANLKKQSGISANEKPTK
jgi:chromosome segregation ATPase